MAGFIQKQLAKALKKTQAEGPAPKPGDFGFAPTPQGVLHRWPCIVVSPTDPRLAEAADALRIYDGLADPRLFVQYVLSDDLTSSTVPFHAVLASDFIPWGCTAHDLVIFLGALASVSSNAVVLGSFLRSVEEVCKLRPNSAPPHMFEVSWAKIPEFPLWPCVVVSPGIARVFPQERWGGTPGVKLIGQLCFT